ncbi:MAG: hypothetical protein PHQ96_04290 [Candidatus Omnitrophica bacterium]|nr:hypothetical protein [Candidatus Omnitrophota bacterium]
MAKIWLYFAQKSCPSAKIYVGDLGMPSELIAYFQSKGAEVLPKKDSYEWHGKNLWAASSYYKLQFLSDFVEPVIYVDLDALILKDLTVLWQLRNDKPFIAVHYWNDENLPISGGLMLVGRPGFINWPTLRSLAEKNNWNFQMNDQDLLGMYFKSIDYKPKHELIGSDFSYSGIDMQWRIEAGELKYRDDAYIVHCCGKERLWQMKETRIVWFYRFPGIEPPHIKLDSLLEIYKSKNIKYISAVLKRKARVFLNLMKTGNITIIFKILRTYMHTAINAISETIYKYK